MDAAKAFFAKYHAVPASDVGPDFATANADALFGWLKGELSLLRRGAGDPKRTILKLAIAEAWARIARIGIECAAKPKDWPERDTLGKLLAALATNADLLTVEIK